MNKLSPSIAKIATVTGLLLGAFALSVLAADVWSPAGCAAPNCNTAAPVNVGNIAQFKEGSLAVAKTSTTSAGYNFEVVGSGMLDGLLVKGLTVTNSLQVMGGAQKDYVLTSNDTNGNAVWKEATGGTGTGSGHLVWEDVSTTGTDYFDQACQYRFYRDYNTTSVATYDLSGADVISKGSIIYYTTGVYPSRLVYLSHKGEVSHIDSSSKSSMSVVNGSPAGATYPITKIEKSCGTSIGAVTSSGGSSGTIDFSTWKTAWYASNGGSYTIGTQMNRYDQFDATNVASLNPNTNTFPTLSSIAICPPKAIQTGTARNPTSNLGIMIRCTAPTFNDLPPSFTLTTTPTGGVI